MSELIAHRAELESKFKDVKEDDHEELADDVLFEEGPNGRRVAVAVKDGTYVCWNCFTLLGSDSGVLDVICGNAMVRICKNPACRAAVGKVNRKRERAVREGRVVQLDDLDETEREDLLNQIEHEKQKYRGF